MPNGFDDLVDEATAADVTGWGFDWLAGRASEQRPPWGFQRQLGRRLGEVHAALDIQTGGGEVLDGIAAFPPTMVATEAWPPNVALATARLHPRGVVVVADPEEPPLPFADAAFDLVTSRHPAGIWWSEIARVLLPGGHYFAQHIGPRSNAELYEYFLGPDPEEVHSRDPQVEAAEARAAGLEVVDLRTARLTVEFRDIGAVVYFLRKVIWTVPDFAVDKYRPKVRELHEQITQDGVFISHSTRTLIDARKPAD
jgi:SAM-dependent methyltransferase